MAPQYRSLSGDGDSGDDEKQRSSGDVEDLRHSGDVEEQRDSEDAEKLPVSMKPERRLTWRERLARRPRRLLALAVGILALLTLISWLNSSDGGRAARMAQAEAQAAEALLLANANGTVPEPVRDPHDFWSGEKPVAMADLAAWGQAGADGNLYPPSFVPVEVNRAPRAKAAFIVLVRNSELDQMRDSMRHIEERFNRKFGYPWVFLNELPFTEEFKKGVRGMTRSEIRFGLIPKEHWSYPDWIDQEKAAQHRKDSPWSSNGIESYHHMIRYQSGYFFLHPATLDFDYYWRVEPGIKMHCDIDYDPFLFMQMNNKTYGFTVALKEDGSTARTLFQQTRRFLDLHPQYISRDPAWNFITDKKEPWKAPWNMCYAYNNQEIADLRFFRSKAYMDYFEHLDNTGGFFYERWGDAPVHTFAASLMLNREQLHQFDDFGYSHSVYTYCPADRKKYHGNGRCDCDPDKSLVFRHDSCMAQWWRTSKEGPPKTTEEAVDAKDAKAGSPEANAKAP